MNSKNLVLSTAVAASLAFSAKAALFVGAAAGAAGISDGVTAADNGGNYNPGPVVLVFTVSSSVNITGLGAFDLGGDGYPSYAGGTGGWTVRLWQNTVGNQGTLLQSADITSSDTLVDSSFRMDSIPSTTLTAGNTYAISLTDNVPGPSNGVAGLFSGFSSGDHGPAATANGDRGAVYDSIFSVSNIVFRGAGSHIIASDVFDTTLFPGSGAFGTSVSGGSVGNYRVVNAEFSVVPEPSTYALIAGAGLVGFGLWRRRAVKA